MNLIWRRLPENNSGEKEFDPISDRTCDVKEIGREETRIRQQ